MDTESFDDRSFGGRSSETFATLLSRRLSQRRLNEILGNGAFVEVDREIRFYDRGRPRAVGSVGPLVDGVAETWAFAGAGGSAGGGGERAGAVAALKARGQRALFAFGDKKAGEGRKSATAGRAAGAVRSPSSGGGDSDATQLGAEDLLFVPRLWHERNRDVDAGTVEEGLTSMTLLSSTQGERTAEKEETVQKARSRQVGALGHSTVGGN